MTLQMLQLLAANLQDMMLFSWQYPQDSNLKQLVCHGQGMYYAPKSVTGREDMAHNSIVTSQLNCIGCGCKDSKVCDLQIQQELVVALARCLACIPAKPPVQPNRLQYVTHLLQDLPPTLQQLASPQTATSTQYLSNLNALAERSLQQLRTLMMFTHSWRDSHSSSQPGQSSNAAVEVLISCWPLLEQVLGSQSGSLTFRVGLAACCTTALRTHTQDCIAVVGSITQAAAHAVAAAGSDAHDWCPPLCAALDQFAAQSGQQKQLLAALRIVESSAAFNIIMDRATADQNPDLATVNTLVCMHLALQTYPAAYM